MRKNKKRIADWGLSYLEINSLYYALKLLIDDSSIYERNNIGSFSPKMVISLFL